MKAKSIAKGIALISVLILTLTSCMEKIAEEGNTVSVNYIGTFEDGEEFDNSYTRGSPLEFVIGAGGMIEGFDEAVRGMKIGEKKTVTLTPDKAYGEIDETKTQVIPRAELADLEDMGIPLEVGGVLPTMMGNFEILEADEETITIDANHEMAGKTLVFEIEIVDIK